MDRILIPIGTRQLQPVRRIPPRIHFTDRTILIRIFDLSSALRPTRLAQGEYPYLSRREYDRFLPPYEQFEPGMPVPVTRTKHSATVAIPVRNPGEGSRPGGLI